MKILVIFVVVVIIVIQVFVLFCLLVYYVISFEQVVNLELSYFILYGIFIFELKLFLIIEECNVFDY